MTKLWIGVLTAGLCSNAWAVIDGEPVDWQAHDNTVEISKCTGTRIGGAFVLTAAHCETNVGLTWIKDAYHDEYQYIVESVYLHPNYVPNYVTEDVALAKLSTPTDYAHIQFLADLSAPTYVQDAPITIDGFGGLNNQPPARAAYKMHYKVQNYPFRIEATQIANGFLTGGDSGSAWINDSNEIMAVSSGISSEGVNNDQTIGGRDLHYAADFILDTVNGWHYPTIATAKGRTTIEVQSLHRGGAVDTAYTSGDATIIAEESSCLTGTIAPFERCTYVIDSGGGKGTLHLSDTESIRLNNASSGGSSGGDSGGSAGWATLLALLGCWHSRRKHKKLVYTQGV
ncbi:trypsin-like serine protease [Vibrio hyugaensis]|uniref:trypsin-like serine protease n=1 Tax=Vibrio hyugaensis TaxID=1534743 RepID=UPI0005EE0413|nr:trypsin-like serine protease [Vibrio hyugaensis]